MSIQKLLIRIESNTVDVGWLECEMSLSAGHSVYYGNEDLPDGEVIKEYPDGRKEIVTFDRQTGEECFLRPFAQE